MGAKQRVVEAVNFLIASANYARLINEITEIIETYDTHPMAYAGDLAVLNSLIDVGLANRDAFEKLLQLAEDKRRLIPEAKRQDYQRELMRERRARVRKAMQLHEIRTGVKLEGAARVKFMGDLQARWRKARDQHVDAKGDISWKERNDAAQEFWAKIDQGLDNNIAAEKALKVKKGR